MSPSICETKCRGPVGTGILGIPGPYTELGAFGPRESVDTSPYNDGRTIVRLDTSIDSSTYYFTTRERFVLNVRVVSEVTNKSYINN